MIQKFRAYNVFSNLEALPWQRVIYKQTHEKKKMEQVTDMRKKVNTISHTPVEIVNQTQLKS